MILFGKSQTTYKHGKALQDNLKMKRRKIILILIYKYKVSKSGRHTDARPRTIFHNLAKFRLLNAKL